MGIVSFSPWNLQQVNSPANQEAGATDGPAAAGDPFASVFGTQRHIAYLDTAGVIHDCWYDSARGVWNHQQINAPGGVTSGPSAAGEPFVWTVGPEQHFTYRDADGVICDSWYSAGRWYLRHINGPSGVTSAPAAAGDPFASVFADQHHIGYLDATGVVYDSWYEAGRWSVQQINGDGGRTRGSPAAGGPFVWTVGTSQQHFSYYDHAGTIHDSWFAGGRWNLRHINGAGGLTDGPRTAGLPFVSVYGDQHHVFYLGRVPSADETGIIHDAWYDAAKDRWRLHQLNGAGGLTTGPPAAARPFASVFGRPAPPSQPVPPSQSAPPPRAVPSPQAGQHVGYRDRAGIVYDAWFDPLTGSWRLQQVTGADGLTPGPAASGGPFVWTVGTSQQHFTYRTANGTIYDAWFNAELPAE
jgi:hypothetical protein